MKRIASRLAWAAFGGMLLFMAGCATTGKVNWDARVGEYTFDQAVLDHGPPDKSATLSDGTKVVEWIVSRGSGWVSFHHHGGYYGPHGHGYFYGPHYGYTSYRPAPDWFLRLTFGPEGKLIDWWKGVK